MSIIRTSTSDWPRDAAVPLIAQHRVHHDTATAAQGVRSSVAIGRFP